MVNDWIGIRSVKITGAERLYPAGIDWQIEPGVNAIVGGTALGKTTLIYAIQYCLFRKVVVEGGDRIDDDYFRNRLTRRSGQDLEKNPPTVEVTFSVAESSFVLRRSLQTGKLLHATCDGRIVGGRYRDILSELIGLKHDFANIVRLHGHLLFFGESRYLIAWENMLQNELLNLLLAEHSRYVDLSKLWEETESADSEARNLSAQASRLEKDLESLNGSSNIRELKRVAEVKRLEQAYNAAQIRLADVQKHMQAQLGLLTSQTSEIERTQTIFHEELDKFEADTDDDLDTHLITAVLAETPTIASVRASLQDFYRAPDARPCPCCGRPGVSVKITRLVAEASSASRLGGCVVCCKDLEAPSAISLEKAAPQSAALDATASSFQAMLFRREQTRARLTDLRRDETTAIRSVGQARDEQIAYLQRNPPSAMEPLRVAAAEMRKRQARAIRKRDASLGELRRRLKIANKAFESIQADIAVAFKKYASLYLDEPCDVELLQEADLPGRRGPQVKAPHAAFFPVVSGEVRPSAQALSDAQRAFVDLAFRMAVVDAWHMRTRKTVTMFVETPEGAVDIAYMERVASMLRTFSLQGHTLIVTTNLNNELFLPELLSAHPKANRMERVLNLLEVGRPHRVQQARMKRFRQILESVASHRTVR